MDLVFAFDFTIDKDIIEIGCTEIVKKFSKNVVDEMLKRGGSVAQTERPDQGFE